MKISVIIPVYNEERTAARVLDNVLAVALPVGMTREVVVVNDGSTDRTAEILENYNERISVIVFHQPNQGKTAALVRGIRESSGDILVIQDADLEYDPIQYPTLLAPILSGEADVVYGSRFLGKIEGMRPLNFWANKISNWVFRLLYGVAITDINTCFKVFKREAIDGLSIVSKNFAFETEVTAKFIQRGL